MGSRDGGGDLHFRLAGDAPDRPGLPGHPAGLVSAPEDRFGAAAPGGGCGPFPGLDEYHDLGLQLQMVISL